MSGRRTRVRSPRGGGRRVRSTRLRGLGVAAFCLSGVGPAAPAGVDQGGEDVQPRGLTSQRQWTGRFAQDTKVLAHLTRVVCIGPCLHRRFPLYRRFQAGVSMAKSNHRAVLVTVAGQVSRPPLGRFSSDSQGGNPVVEGREETLPPVGGRLYVQSCPAITKSDTVWQYQQ